MCNPKERLSKNDEQISKSYGGYEELDWQKEEKEQNYCDKGGHKERSIANDPKHENHWKKH